MESCGPLIVETCRFKSFTCCFSRNVLPQVIATVKIGHCNGTHGHVFDVPIRTSFVVTTTERRTIRWRSCSVNQWLIVVFVLTVRQTVLIRQNFVRMSHQFVPISLHCCVIFAVSGAESGRCRQSTLVFVTTLCNLEFLAGWTWKHSYVIFDCRNNVMLSSNTGCQGFCVLVVNEGRPKTTRPDSIMGHNGCECHCRSNATLISQSLMYYVALRFPQPGHWGLAADSFHESRWCVCSMFVNVVWFIENLVSSIGCEQHASLVRSNVCCSDLVPQ